jgi:iron complex outermembrane recepter protein
MKRSQLKRHVRETIECAKTPHRRRLVASIAGSAIATAVASMACAQSSPPNGAAADSAKTSSAPPESALALQEITVTAERRPETVKDVPYAISAVSGAVLAQLGITDMAGLSNTMPGVTFLDKGAYAGLANNTIIIHGLNVEITGGLIPNQTQSPVATYVGDDPVFVNLHLTDLDRVEVLRGPQGTLYGSGSLGGTVRYLQNDPDLGNYQVIANSGTGYTYNARSPNYNGDLIVNLPLTSTFALRFEAGYTHDAGFIALLNSYALGPDRVPLLAQSGNELKSPPVYSPQKDANDSTIHNYRVAALWQATDDLRIRFNFNRQETDAGGPPEINPTIYGNTLNSAAYSTEPINDLISLYSADVAYDFGFATLTSSTSAYNHEVRAYQDQTTVFEALPFYSTFYGDVPRPYFDSLNILDDKGFTEELRLASKSSTFLDYVVGAYYSHQHATPSYYQYDRGYYDYYNACVPVYGAGSNECGYGEFYGTLPTESGVPVQKDLSFLQSVDNRFADRAAYGELTWHILPKLDVTGGARVFSQLLNSTVGGGLLFVGPAYVASRVSSVTNTGVLGKFDLSYKISPTMSTYFNWSQGFRRGENNALPPTTDFGTLLVTPAAAFSAKPDTADNFEVGLKGSFQRITYDLSAYDIQWHNIQATISATPIFIPAVLNVGDGFSRGVDLALSGYITSHIFGQVNYSFNDCKLTTVAPLVYEVATAPFEGGGRFPGVPEQQLNWRFEYRQDIDEKWQLHYGVDGNARTGSSSTISSNSSRVPGFSMWDLYLIATNGNLSARLFVDNVANTLGFTARANPAEQGPNAPWYISTPRTVGLSLSYSFSAPR